jgi:hypothetical protein
MNLNRIKLGAIKRSRIEPRLLVALAALHLTATIYAQEPEQVLAAEFPPQSITTVEQANEALKKAPAARAAIANRSLRATAACHDRFLMSACLNDVRERDRKANKIVRRVEVEANALLRKEKAAERDRAVAERETRAAEQRAKAISITGSARETEPSEDTPDAHDSGR